MGLHSKHSAWISGSRRFGEWLAKIPGVKQVNKGNVRSSKVKPCFRQPEVIATETSVYVDYFSGGEMLRFFTFPEKGLSLKGLARRIRQALALHNERGGIGMSPKDEIVIPEHLRRKMVMMEEKEQLTEEIKALPPSPVVTLTKIVAEGYEFLLDFAPTPQHPEFSITRVWKKLFERFGKSQATNVLTSLKNRRLIIPGENVSTNANEGKTFTIIRNPYSIKDDKKEKVVKPQVIEAKPKKPAGVNILKLVENLQKKVNLLEKKGVKVEISSKSNTLKIIEEVFRKVTLLEEKGFKVEILNGEIILRHSLK